MKKEIKNNNFNFSPIYNYGGEWNFYQGVWAKGYAFTSSGELLTGTQLAAFIQSILLADKTSPQLKILNGRFSAAGSIKDFNFLLNDRTGSFPLFYNNSKEIIHCSDSVQRLINKSSRLVENHINQFLSTGFVWNDSTLISNIKRCEPSSLILFKKNIVQKEKYFSYSCKQPASYSKEEASDKLITALNNAMERSLQIINNNHIVIPLTSGYDSRFITSWLKMNSNKSMTTFTCGTKDSTEFINARQVANKLELKWNQILHDEETLVNNLPQENELNEYLDFCCGASSMSFFQDVPSMKKMNLPSNSIIVGGHSADFLAGSHLWPLQNKMPIKTIIKHASKRMSPYASHLNEEKNIKEILKNTFLKNEDKQPYSIVEDIDFFGRQCQYILNSTKTYDFFGKQTILPFLDNEVVDFFKSLPFNLKLKKKLYDKTLIEHFFKPLNINFQKEYQPTNTSLFRQLVKYSLPTFISEVYTSRKEIPDTCNYKTISRLLDYEEQGPISHPNEYMFNWYIQYLENKIKELQ